MVSRRPALHVVGESVVSDQTIAQHTASCGRLQWSVRIYTAQHTALVEDSVVYKPNQSLHRLHTADPQ